jgi:DNA polymerase III subunit epsilon
MNKRRSTTLIPFNRFAAIDFETADYGRDSACAIAVIVADKGEIVEKRAALIRPPRTEFLFTWLHGIDWGMVEREQPFGPLWPTLSGLFDGVEFIAAHNASFDRGVLRACCAMAGIEPPACRFLCTMKLARRVWGLYPTKLSDVCNHFGFPLNHHDAESDALACARIVLEAGATGIPESAFLSS